MNWGSDFFWKIYEWIGRYIRMNCGSDFFSEGKIYEWIGRYTNELGFRFFFGIIFIYFIFSIGRLGFWNLKIYEWIGRYTNELGFGFFLEDIRMNWKIYEWIGVQIFFWRGKFTNELEDIRMNWGSDFFGGRNNKWNIYFIFSIGGLGLWNLKIYEWIGRYTNELVQRYTNELGFRFFFGDIRYLLEDI